MTQGEKAEAFRNLHTADTPLLLTNIWDVGSAKTVADTGAKALATGSWSVAAAHGYGDGEKLPLELVLANLERIVASVGLPVSLDIEAGYSKTPEGVGKTITAVLKAGAVGINLEDQMIGGGGLYGTESQCERIRSAREAAERTGTALFINARTDIYLQADPATYSEEPLTEAVRRGNAYAEAGADGFFVPGLRDAAVIKTLCQHVLLPLNIMTMDDTLTTAQLAALGVARISAGPRPYIAAMNTLKNG